MKISLNNHWYQCGLACLILAVSAVVAYGQAPVVFGFNGTADTSPWDLTGGNVTLSSSFINGDAPSGSPSSGALGISGTYDPTYGWGQLAREFTTVDLSAYTDVSFWVKNEGPWDSGGGIQAINFLFGYDPNFTSYQSPQFSLSTPGNDGWNFEHFKLSQFSPSDPSASLSQVNMIRFSVVDGYYTSATTLSLGIDDIQFYAVPEPSSLALFGFGAVVFGFICRFRRKIS